MEIQKPLEEIWTPSNESRYKALVLLSHLFQAKPIEMTDMVIAALAGNLTVTPTTTGVTFPEPIPFTPNFLFSCDALKDLLLAEPYNFDPKLLEVASGDHVFSYLVNAITDGLLKAMDSSFGLITPDTVCAVHHELIEDPAAREGFEFALKHHLRKASIQLTALEKARPLTPPAEAGFAAQKPSAEWFLEETRGHHGLEFSDMMVKYTIVPMFEHNPFRAMFVLARVDRLCKTFDLKAADHANAWAYICENIPCPEVRMTPIYSILASSVAAEPWEVIEHLVYTALTRYAKMLMSIQGCPVLSVTTLAALLSYVRTEERRRIIVELF